MKQEIGVDYRLEGPPYSDKSTSRCHLLKGVKPPKTMTVPWNNMTLWGTCPIQTMVVSLFTFSVGMAYLGGLWHPEHFKENNMFSRGSFYGYLQIGDLSVSSSFCQLKTQCFLICWLRLPSKWGEGSYGGRNCPKKCNKGGWMWLKYEILKELIIIHFIKEMQLFAYCNRPLDPVCQPS